MLNWLHLMYLLFAKGRVIIHMFMFRIYNEVLLLTPHKELENILQMVEGATHMEGICVKGVEGKICTEEGRSDSQMGKNSE
jgi:hypothetical protein